MKKFTFLLVLVSLLFAIPTFADVYTQLVKVSNENGLLVVNLQAKSDAGEPIICLYRGAFKISETLEKRVKAVSFDNLLFTSPEYTTQIGYDSNYRKFYWVFTYNTFTSGEYTTIPEDWVTVLQVGILYNTADEIASLSWAGSPSYKVLGGADCGDITGDYLPIPPDLEDLPLPVEMSAYSAVIEESSAIITWRTETELDNLGFNVYRSESEANAPARVNSELIRGQGSTSTAHDYQYLDNTIEPDKEYWYSVETISMDGLSTYYGPFQATAASRVISAGYAPSDYSLAQNYPNPFNPSTQFRYELPAGEHVTLTVYNLLGNTIKTLTDGFQSAGAYVVTWDGRDNHGKQLESGIFIYELRAGQHVLHQKMTLLK
jgi:hypothetical protein